MRRGSRCTRSRLPGYGLRGCVDGGRSHQQALTRFGDLGNRLGQAEALNRLGELATRTADTPQALEHHARALAIARDISAAPEEARALEGLGRAHIHGSNHGKGQDCLRQALTIYQRIGGTGSSTPAGNSPRPKPAGKHRRPDPRVITPAPG
jgi:hypothetical protein